MNIVGLITEYNPFHNGHLHHINLAKKLTNADYVVVVMSGNFLQRGTPAIIDKYKRTEMALKCGADLVIELPSVFATASAESFALGAVSLLHQMGCINSLCFGSECGEIKQLEDIAEILTHEPKEFKQSLKHFLKEGYVFPVARKMALLQYMKKDFTSQTELDTILSEPNNILAIEYIKAIKRLNSPIKPVTIKRIVSGYHDTQLHDTICSASAIRSSLKLNGMDCFKNQIPPSVYHILAKEYKITFPIEMNDFSSLLKYKLLLAQDKPYSEYLDVSEALANAIRNHLSDFINAESFMELLKNKQYTLTRINRSLIHILLNIETDVAKEYADNGYAQYIRILGFQKTSHALLSTIKKNATIPIISKLANYKKILNPLGILMLEQDIFSTEVYQSVVTHKFNRPPMNEFKQKLILL
ncbi:nucleotidyltransferase [Candidatus Galacturonibacter soehngenii]|uniref:tRNA(Met) cytidine acetate ligase n=1 Tax=Candidatus Galacturonatibacter soehngenii TaxID=2307010 RepID=A0A7V7UHF6_9FIRM|nr:nucleotidyltransferase [Candidatus Galacturonibacter soehngenii]KAB1439933.1 nucleotidyltransferase [Candidatus Galacturonibacter soehngenii]